MLEYISMLEKEPRPELGIIPWSSGLISLHSMPPGIASLNTRIIDESKAIKAFSISSVVSFISSHEETNFIFRVDSTRKLPLL